MDKDIVVGNRLGKILEWFEKRSHPVKALIITLLGSGVILLFFGLLFLIYSTLGIIGLVFAVTFFFSYLFVLANL